MESYSVVPRSEPEKHRNTSLIPPEPSLPSEMYSDASRFHHRVIFPTQMAPHSSPIPLFPLLNLQEFGTASRGCDDYGNESNFTACPVQTLNDSHDYQQSIKQEAWSMPIPPESTHSSSSTPVIYQDYHSAHDITPSYQTHSNHMERSLLPPATGSYQQPSSRSSTFSNDMGDVFTDPRLRLSHHFALQATDSSEPSGHSSASFFHGNLPPRSICDDSMTFDSYETDSECTKSEPPYAKLIYQALMEAQDYKLVLRDIYAWISRNTDKAKDPAFKGWQNSVRHNLSMNGAFKKVPHIDPTNKHKKGYIWVLEPSAIERGIESTTRYRQKTAGKRSDNSDVVDPKRQSSGRKGGRAARKSAKLRRSAKPADDSGYGYAHLLDHIASDSSMSSPNAADGSLSPDLSFYNTSGLPYYLDTPTSDPAFTGHSQYDYREATLNDEGNFSNSFSNVGDFLPSKPEDPFGGQGTTAFT